MYLAFSEQLRREMVSFRMSLLQIFCIMFGKALAESFTDFATQQIVIYNETHTNPVGHLTVSNGVPVVYENIETYNSPLLLHQYFMDTMAHVLCENIPERVVHGKGTGAFGYFNVTNDVTNYTKASFLSETGKVTPVLFRGSTAVTGKGGIDTAMDIRGFAVKFYTEEGNFDMVGLNQKMFGFDDPVYFSTLVHSQKRNPVTNLAGNPNTVWDFIAERNESLYIFMHLFGSKGIPDGYRSMPGYSIHTFEMINKEGVRHFARMHFEPKNGTRYLNTTQAKLLGCEEPDYATKDLYNAIASGDYPCWTVYLQPVTEDQARNASEHVFSIVEDLSVETYPLVEAGEMCLDKNVENYHAQVEQAAFCPCNLVPGIGPAPDKTFEARSFAYREAQMYRLGSNFRNIEVNRPRCKVLTNNRDGVAPVLDNGRDRPNYFPNIFKGPLPVHGNKTNPFRYHQRPSNNSALVSDLYEGLTEYDKNYTISNIASSLSGVTEALQDKVILVLSRINSDLGSRVKEALINLISS